LFEKVETMSQLAPIPDTRTFDVICLGRLAVDLYAQQVGVRLEDVTSFAKYLGGSSANIAFGAARLGLKAAMLSRVGDDHMGAFLLEALAREGCDVSHVRKDPARLTALVILGLKDRETFPLIFYREDCADMAVDVDDFDEAFIAKSRALVITGTHFSTPKVHATSMRALEYARRNEVRTVLDIDYRPVLWGLTQKGDGETRFVAAGHVTEHLQKILPQFDLVVGTEEEFRIAGGEDDLVRALGSVRAVTPATLVVKRGPLGCSVIEGQVTDDLEGERHYRGVQVEVLNVLGAGDAFLSGFLKGWLTGADYARCCTIANACGAMVVSRHACAPAMPTEVELTYFLANEGRLRRPDQDATLARLHRVSVPRAPRDAMFVFAFDHRTQFYELARECGAAEDRLPAMKRLFVRAVEQVERAGDYQGSIGVLIDDHYGQEALDAATGRGWWVGRPVEVPGSNPLEFEHGRSVGSRLLSWPAEHVVKCLVQFDPDDPAEHRLEQETQLRALYDAVQTSGHELLLEVIPPCAPKASGDDERVLRSLKRLYNLGILPEWWKLEPMSATAFRAVDALIAERDPYCRGVVLLGLNASPEELARGFAEASGSASCRGFMVGRTIFYAPARAWLRGTIDDDTLIERVRAGFEALIRLWRDARASRSSRAQAEYAA
jgi:5-dehydro-2-deoxygluconokinase